MLSIIGCTVGRRGLLGAPSVVHHALDLLVILTGQADDDQHAEADEEHYKHEQAEPDFLVCKAIEFQELLRLLKSLRVVIDRELKQAQRGETVADRGQILQPGDVALR